MSNGLVRTFLLGLAVSGAAISSAQLATFHSGNGGGSTDSQITATPGDITQDFHQLVSQDFTNARTGPSAYILSPLAAGWVSDLGDGSGARWVGLEARAGDNSTHSESGLYAIDFNLASSASDAALNLRFSVDDQLGGVNNEGLFLDGHAIAGSRSQTDWNNQIEDKHFFLGSLAAGTHTLYFDVVNSGNGPAGIIFNGDIQAVPEPAPMAALGFGALGIVLRRRSKRA